MSHEHEQEEKVGSSNIIKSRTQERRNLTPGRKTGRPPGSNNKPKKNKATTLVKNTSYSAKDGLSVLKSKMEQIMKGPNQVEVIYGMGSQKSVQQNTSVIYRRIQSLLLGDNGSLNTSVSGYVFSSP